MIIRFLIPFFLLLNLLGFGQTQFSFVNKNFRIDKSIISLATISEHDTINLTFDTIPNNNFCNLTFLSDSNLLFHKVAVKETVEYLEPVFIDKDTTYQIKKTDVMWIGGEFGKWYFEYNESTLCIAYTDSEYITGKFTKFLIINKHPNICLIRK